MSSDSYQGVAFSHADKDEGLVHAPEGRNRIEATAPYRRDLEFAADFTACLKACPDTNPRSSKSRHYRLSPENQFHHGDSYQGVAFSHANKGENLVRAPEGRNRIEATAPYRRDLEFAFPTACLKACPDTNLVRRSLIGF